MDLMNFEFELQDDADKWEIISMIYIPRFLRA